MTDDIQTGRNVLKPIWNDIDFDHSDQALGIKVPDKVKPVPAEAIRIDLPQQEKWPSSDLNLIEALLHRKSNRHFVSDYLSLEELSLLLYCTQGIRRITENSSFRAVPSAGARHCFETYLYVDRIRNLDKGLVLLCHKRDRG